MGEVAIKVQQEERQQESRHEDRGGRAVFGKLQRIQTKMYLEEHGKVGPEGKVDLSYWAKDCRLYLQRL